MNETQLPYNLARSTCAAAMTELSDLPARVDEAACQSFAASLDVAEVKRLGASLASDVNATQAQGTFESADVEAALIVLFHALDFGGGWRLALHAYHKKGAFLTVKPGVEAIFRENPTLDINWLANRNNKDVGKLFQIVGDSEEAKALAPFVEQLTGVINEVGSAVGNAGYSTITEWFKVSLAEANKTDTPAALLVQDLVSTFPNTFNDRHSLRGLDVVLFKKAQLVVGEIYHRFRDEDDRMNFADGEQLTAFIDNVICACLRKVGAVAATKDLSDKIDSHVLLPSGGEEEVSFRAAAMIALERVAELASTDDLKLTPNELGNYLWGVLGKTEEFRPYPRHATRDTVFY